MPLPPPITVTERAGEYIRALLASAPPEDGVIGLRVGVKAKGCSGNSYVFEYAREVKKFEDVVEAHGVKVLIDPAATMFVLGSVMDYTDSDTESGLTLKNPNEKGRCGCGESFYV